jgi:predicted helicase
LQVYLTNTLEPIAPQANWLLPALSEEADKAQEIKNKPILVITGNPPYSGESKNKGAWITAKINAYKMVDGKPLGEKNPKWLSDDYVKFIRFAQDKIDQVPEGIVGIITNHSFLDNPTFRGMRQSLINSFDKIYVLDLHGNAKKKETAPDGSKDENVFDIEQGVSISLFIKTRKPQTRNVWRADIWGKRLEKYEACARLSYSDVNWRQVEPSKPFYLFETGNAVLEQEYRKGFSVQEIFPVNSVGIVTARDSLAVQFDQQTMLSTVADFSSRDIEDARQYYNLGADARDWRVNWAQDDIINSGANAKLILPLNYRPFDKRWTYFTGNSRGFLCNPRENVMRNMLQENIGFLTCRQTSGDIWEHAFVANTLVDDSLVSNRTKERGYLFPLYIYNLSSVKAPSRRDLETGVIDPFLDDKNHQAERSENMFPDFRKEINVRYSQPIVTPEQIFGYIYAIVHAPTYRTRYSEFLRGDFPRIPLCGSRQHFESLSALGWELAQKHLLKSLPKKTVSYKGKGDNSVDKPHYSETEQAVYINATQYFAPVTEAIWTFHIGGYQVIDKYLKSRKGRTLTLDEVNNIENIVTVLNFTIGQIAAIDQAYLAAFPGHAHS